MTHPAILAPIDAPVDVIATLNGKPFLARFIPITNHGQPSSPRAVRGPAPFDVAIGGAGNSRVRG